MLPPARKRTNPVGAGRFYTFISSLLSIKRPRACFASSKPLPKLHPARSPVGRRLGAAEPKPPSGREVPRNEAEGARRKPPKSRPKGVYGIKAKPCMASAARPRHGIRPRVCMASRRRRASPPLPAAALPTSPVGRGFTPAATPVGAISDRPQISPAPKKPKTALPKFGNAVFLLSCQSLQAFISLQAIKAPGALKPSQQPSSRSV